MVSKAVRGAPHLQVMGHLVWVCRLRTPDILPVNGSRDCGHVPSPAVHGVGKTKGGILSPARETPASGARVRRGTRARLHRDPRARVCTQQRTSNVCGYTAGGSRRRVPAHPSRGVCLRPQTRRPLEPPGPTPAGGVAPRSLGPGAGSLQPGSHLLAARPSSLSSEETVGAT